MEKKSRGNRLSTGRQEKRKIKQEEEEEEVKRWQGHGWMKEYLPSMVRLLPFSKIIHNQTVSAEDTHTHCDRNLQKTFKQRLQRQKKRHQERGMKGLDECSDQTA